MTVFDEDFSLPLGLAPCGLTGMQMANGELHSAKAAEKFGVPFTLSTMSIASIEDVAEYVEKQGRKAKIKAKGFATSDVQVPCPLCRAMVTKCEFVRGGKV